MAVQHNSQAIRKRFETNLRTFEGILPQVASAISQAGPGSLQVGETRAGELTLQGPEEQCRHYHASYSAVQEAERWFAGLDLSGVEVLFVYGVGMGHYYSPCRRWLEEDAGRYLVFLEDDLHVLYHLFHSELGEKILKDRQVQLHYLNWQEPGPMLEWLSWYFAQAQGEFSTLDAYGRVHRDRYAEIRRMLMHEMVVRSQQVAEYLRHGAGFFHNFYSNSLHLHESYQGSNLFGKFKGVPAVICGAGPSLNRNFHVLETMRDRALIFGGGSSLNALSSRGLLPHFGAGIDPNPTQLERLTSNTAFEVPFFYRSRMHYQAFESIMGPRLYVNGTGGYPIGQHIESVLDIEAELIDEGHNVVNFCAEIARAMGCDPIIFVGMDLAYTGMQAYAGGVVANSEVEEEAIVASQDLESGAFPRRDIHGKPVYTLWKWVAESQWLAEFAQRWSDVTVINATEGGLGISGVANVTLDEVKEQYCSRHQDLSGRVWSEIQDSAMPGVTRERMVSLLRSLRVSLERCQQYVEEMLTELQALYEGKHSTLSNAENLEKKLLAEDAYRPVLAVFNEVYGKAFGREVHQARHDLTLKTDEDRRKRQLEVNMRKFQFLHDTITANLTILRRVQQTRQKVGDPVALFDEDTP